MKAEGNTPSAGTKKTGITQGNNQRKPDATEYSRGRKWNGRRDRNNGRTNSRALERYGEEYYRMVSADGVRENVWAATTTQEFSKNF